MLKHLGTERFGIWALLGMFSSYTLVKSVAELKVINQTDRLNNVLSTAAVLYLILAVFLGVVLLSITNLVIVHVFRIPESLVSESIILFKGTIIIFCLNIISNIFVSIINGIQRTDIYNIILTGSTILNAIGAYYFLMIGKGLFGLLINNAITLFLVGVASWLVVRKYAPEIQLQFKRFDRKEVKQILKYGSNIQITNIAGLAGDPMIRAIISNVGGLGYVAYYEIAMRLLNPLRFLFNQALAPIMPFVAELNILKKTEAIVGFFSKSFRYILLLSIPVFALSFFLVPSFINIWIGNNYAVAAITFQILLIAQFTSVLSLTSYFIFLSTNVSITMFFAVGNGLLDLLFCLVLGYFWGYMGVIVGFSLAMLLLSVLSILIILQTYHVDYVLFLRSLPIGALGFVIIMSIIASSILMRLPNLNLLGLIIVSGTFMILYAAYLIISRTVSLHEIKSVTSTIKLSMIKSHVNIIENNDL
jgi:O-antigen/teichoic acid export membrane protein